MTTKLKTTKENTKEDEKNSPMRFSKEITKAIKNEVIKLNKQKKGSKRITPSDVLEVLWPMLNENHRKHILSKTITSSNRQDVAFANYTKKQKGVSKDDFLDMIQYGEVKINDYLPDDMKRQKISSNIKNLETA